MDVGERRDRDGQGMQAGMRGKVSAKFGARLQLPWPLSRSRHQLLDQDVLTSICGRAEGGRWELASATGIGAARPGAAGSVGSAGGLVVHGGAGGAATVRDQAHGAHTFSVIADSHSSALGAMRQGRRQLCSSTLARSQDATAMIFVLLFT